MVNAVNFNYIFFCICLLPSASFICFLVHFSLLKYNYTYAYILLFT